MTAPRTVVENVLTLARTKKLWTVIYEPVLPFTIMDFEIGALLPAMLYMARWGHRRGAGKFAKVFDTDRPCLTDVSKNLLREPFFENFSDDYGQEMLSDLLLTWCLENVGHQEGHDKIVQRVLPSHYYASWIDLPKQVAHLRLIPEMLTVLLANQRDGEGVVRRGGRTCFPIGPDNLTDNHLLKLFARFVSIDGQASDRSSDSFDEENANGLGIDELLTVRLADVCKEPPYKAKGSAGIADITNQWPIAWRAAEQLRGDLATVIKIYGPYLPRQALLPMLQSGIGLGLVNLLFMTTRCLAEWHRSGTLPKDPEPLPLWVDCSNGQDQSLRDASEASVRKALAQYERLPVWMMLLRILDDGVSNDPKCKRTQPPPKIPDATGWINLLGEIYQGRHDRSEAIEEGIDRDCLRLAGELREEAKKIGRVEAPQTTEAATANLLEIGSTHPAERLAEVLVQLMGNDSQIAKFNKALESSLMSNQPHSLSQKRREVRQQAGARRIMDQRSIVLSTPLLDFLVHRHLRQQSKGKGKRHLPLRQFLKILRESYGLYVDQDPPGLPPLSQELKRNNKIWLERRLRDLGLLVGVNDAEGMKFLCARFSDGDTDHQETMP
ncbi:MAG: hypothetical protein HQL58_12285 [Magnetococcales bacterium]|nr:hypothetical protein [Magnetococcales bacterium]